MGDKPSLRDVPIGYLLDIMLNVYKGGCMARFREGLYSVHIESCVITLTLVSVLAITGELLINLHIVQVPPRNPINGVSDNTSGVDVRTSQNNSVGSSIDPGGSPAVDPLQTPHLVFHYISLVIAAIFLIEIMLKILAKGKSFFLRIFQVADALIVLGTFALEVVFTVEQEELPLLEAATYIVILRLWRVPYVCNIKAKECKREMQQELEVWQNAKYKLEDRCRDMQTRIDKQQEQMREMEKQIEKYTKDKHNNAVKKTEIGIRKDKSNKAPVSNGHIPHVTFSQVNEENSNHVRTSANQESSAPVSDHTSENSVDGVIQELNKDNTESTEQLPESVDTLDTNDTQADVSQDRGPFSRTDSESSLSCDHVEQEVVVQIEGPPSPKHKLSTTDETVNLIEAPLDKGPEEFSYSNAMFEDEIGHQDLPVLHEIDGVKTYRSADGIPMTSL